MFGEKAWVVGACRRADGMFFFFYGSLIPFLILIVIFFLSLSLSFLSFNHRCNCSYSSSLRTRQPESNCNAMIRLVFLLFCTLHFSFFFALQLSEGTLTDCVPAQHLMFQDFLFSEKKKLVMTFN